MFLKIGWIGERGRKALNVALKSGLFFIDFRRYFCFVGDFWQNRPPESLKKGAALFEAIFYTKIGLFRPIFVKFRAKMGLGQVHFCTLTATLIGLRLGIFKPKNAVYFWARKNQRFFERGRFRLPLLTKIDPF